jgi:two-component system, OmpR family, phosphate regulon sensor histidine kinase PhoR
MFAVGGVVCLGLDARYFLSSSVEQSLEGRLGAAMLLVSAVVSICSQLFLRRDCTTLSAQIRDLAGKDDLLKLLHAASSDLEPLTRSVNELLESAERSVGDAFMRVKELEIQLKVATNERRHAEAIIYSISDAVLVSDAFDEVILANDSAARTFDFELGAGRRPIGQIMKDATLVELIRDMRASASKNGRRIVEHKMRTPHGTKVYKVTLSCVSDRGEGAGGVVTVLHDMTKEKEVSQMKNEFVSSVSHELRTPLASIKAYIEMLIDGEAEDRKTQQEFYEVIQNESNRLSRLIDNILNISRIESGLVQITKKPLSLPVVLREALEVITPQAKMKQIKLVEKATPAFYQTMADKDMIYQAVLNLLSNAVKYTPENGTITVETEVNEQQKKVVTRISDTGVGIPEKDVAYVFDKFYRVEQNNKMAKGTGLGLSLVKHIIETAHKGRIFVESKVGKGTTFGFELDLCE